METLQHILAFDSLHPLLFTQQYFWVFLAIVYIVYLFFVERFGKHKNVSSARIHIRNIYLMLISWFFYYKTSGVFLILLLVLTLTNWLAAQAMAWADKHNQPIGKRLWLIGCVLFDLGLLAYFKYAYFTIDVINQLLSTDLSIAEKIILPVGISFYTFQVISYIADVYRNRIAPVSNILDFGLYVSFFPQLVAGPIVRASEFVPQLYRPFCLSRRLFGLAVFWIVNGLCKKIILSDFLATHLIDRVFDNPLLFSGFENAFALFAYSLQVYADFSGYTDIAIGVAMFFGFYLPDNFHSPYKARNPQEFWRRWHISLSRWLKTYLYIPLGGNRNATWGTWIAITFILLITILLSHTWIVAAVAGGLVAIVALVAWLVPSHRKLLYANLNSLITMLVGGLWHGASWNFVIWGGLNGIGMIVNKLWRDRSRHLQMLLLTAAEGLTAFFASRYPTPLLRLLAVWGGVLWIGMTLRWIWGFLPWAQNRLSQQIGNLWAIMQTFVFITFTRLFFRSSSNLDPVTANQVAWDTAKNMVQQIGGAWNNHIIIPFLWEYRTVVLLFIVGMIIHWLPDRFKRWYRLQFAMMPLLLMALCVIIAFIVLYQFVTADMQPFIYFQF